MSHKEERLGELFDLYIRKIANEKEETELMQLLIDPELAGKKAALLDQMYEREPDFAMTDVQSARVFADMMIQYDAEKTRTPVIKMAWMRWVAAASVILILGVGSLLFFRSSLKQNELANNSQKIVTDIKAPSKNRAMITLSDGQTVYLDSAANGKLLQEDGVAIVKLADGKIAYNGSSTEVVYNTLSNPKGSKVIDMVLSDGTHVWLNAGSSVTFPLAFVGKERKVSITGEAYFEVTKNANMPFKVNVSGKCEVEVLGTHFNINSYSDEATINTTLLEGSVKVTGLHTKASQLITPGQQVQVNSNEQIALNTRPNLESVMAWKNGYFHFDNADLQMVMRQLARWYDIEVVYKGEVPKRQFAGEMQLDLNLSQMLRILETNNVHFKIEEGKKIVVSEQN